MNNGVKYGFAFLLGVAAGVAASWQFFKEKYKKIADEEIESVKECFGRKTEVIDDTADETKNESDMQDYMSRVAKEGYTNYSKEVKDADTNRPYVISPDEFDENGYRVVTLTYYADGVLTDEANIPIEDVDSTVGKDSLEHFGEYEPDSVFVRDDEKEIDYEILLDVRRYSDIYSSNPHQS